MSSPQQEKKRQDDCLKPTIKFIPPSPASEKSRRTKRRSELSDPDTSVATEKQKKISMGDQQEGSGKARRKTSTRKWWHSLPSSEQDPISLEPLRRLRIEPFVVNEDGHEYRFDGRALAAYLVSSQQFLNPLTRRELDLEACARLDAHLDANGCRSQSVARAWELRQEGPSGESERLRREAREVMSALFEPRRSGSGATLRDGVSSTTTTTTTRTQRGEGLSQGGVVDDDEEPFFSGGAQTLERDGGWGDDDEPSRGAAAARYPALPDVSSEASRREMQSAADWAAQRAASRPREDIEAERLRQERRRLEVQRKEAEAEAERRRVSRFDRLASAFGVERDAEALQEDVRWPFDFDLVTWARGDRGDQDSMTGEGLRRLERKLANVVRDKRPVDLPPMRDARQRQRVRDLLDFYALEGDEFDADAAGRRAKYLRVRPTRAARIPKPLLSQATDKAGPPIPAATTRIPQQQRRVTAQRRGLSGTSSSGANNNNRRRRGDDDSPPEPAKNVWDLLNDHDDDDDEKTPDATRRGDYQGSTEDECPICLMPWSREEDSDETRPVVLQCGHKFHSKCLSNWSQIMQHTPPDESDVRFDHVLRTTSCPQCRQPHTFAKIPLPSRRWSNVAASS